MKEHVKILTDSAIVIQRIAQLLEEEKIPSLVKDNVESARLAGFGIPLNDVELYVYTTDVDRAEMIIKSFIKNEGQQ